MNKTLVKSGELAILVAFLLAALCSAAYLYAPALARTSASIQAAPTKTWVVNNTSDRHGDCAPGDCSLRQAMTDANLSTGADLIVFNIPTSDHGYNPLTGLWEITLTAPLPILSDSFTNIDAQSQPAPAPPEKAVKEKTAIGDCATPLINIKAMAVNYGFEVTGKNIFIAGFNVYGAKLANIYIHGTNAQNGVVTCNIIEGSSGDGIFISNSATQQIISFNLVSGNDGDGIEINNARQTDIVSNYIGVDLDGLSDLANGENGILMTNGAISNTVSTALSAGITLISGNAKAGVRIQGDTSQGNSVHNAIIGLSYDEKTVIPNQDGVVISQADHNILDGNIISGNKQDGVAVLGGQDNFISNSWIGTNKDLDADLGNQRYGILLDNESRSSVIFENYIDYNGYSLTDIDYSGVMIQDASTRNILHWNEIAFNAADGVQITGATTAENFLDENSIFDNGLLGINLEDHANNDLAAPILTSYVLRKSGSVTLEATASDCLGCLFQVFSDDDGEGRYYEGQGHVSSSGSLSWKGKPKGKACTLIVNDIKGNTSEFSAAPVSLDLSIDDALPHVTVNKLIGDSTSQTGNTIVEVVAKITSRDPSLTTNFAIQITVPGNVLSTPSRVFYRDSPSSLDGTAITSYTSPSSGVYKLTGISLAKKTSSASDPEIWYERLIVFRFKLPDTMAADSSLILTGDLSAGNRALTSNKDQARIRVVTHVQGIILTNRTALYGNNYRDNNDNDVTKLLQTAFSIAQGPPYVNYAPLLAVYYVDQYDTTVRDWDNTAVDYTNATTANEVSVLIDEMIHEWFWNSTTYYQKWCPGVTELVPASMDFTIVILGDDDVVPYYRSGDPVSSEDDSDWNASLDSVLYDLASNDDFFTDNPYADVYQGICYYTRDWEEGGVEAYIGRIVGASPADMKRLINSGISGPALGKSKVGLVASYGGVDADNIQAYMNTYGLYAPSLMVDDNNWDHADLLAFLTDTPGFVAFNHGGHGYSFGWCTPEDDCVALSPPDVYDNAVLSNTLKLHPVVSSHSCRGAMSLGPYTDSSMVNAWVHAGASSIMGSTGIAYSNHTEGIAWYGEELMQHYWYNVLLINKFHVSTGFALQLNKSNYSLGVTASSWEEKTLQEYTLFGLPWVGFYITPTTTAPAMTNLRAALPPEALSWTPGAPDEVSANTYVVTTTLDASHYTLSQVNGFDLVNVQGMRLDFGDDGPAVPMAELSLPLPLGSTVEQVQVASQDAISLGTLHIPLFTPGIPMPGGPPDAYSETPASFGTYPTQNYSATVTSVGSAQLAQVTVFPLVYNAATDQATLYQSLVVSITYQVPTSVGLLGFGAEPVNAAVGDPLHISATLLNASNQDIQVTGVLTLTNFLGEALDSYSIPPFTLPAASQEYILELDWTPSASEGPYNLELEVWHAGEQHMVAQQAVAFVSGRVTRLMVTPLVQPNYPAIFETTFENLGDNVFEGLIHYQIFDASGLRRLEFDVPLFNVAPHIPMTVETLKDVSVLPPGAYTVTAMVTDQSRTVNYGPLQQEFVIQYGLFLPLVTR